MEREVSKMKVIYAVFLGRSLCFLPSSHPFPNTVHPLLYGCSKCLLHNSFWERIYPGTNQIVLTININTLIQSRNYRCQIRGHNPQPVYENRESPKYTMWSINATTTGRHLVSYRYQSEGHNYWTQIKGRDPQPVLSKQSRRFKIFKKIRLGSKLLLSLIYGSGFLI